MKKKMTLEQSRGSSLSHRPDHASTVQGKSTELALSKIQEAARTGARRKRTCEPSYQLAERQSRESSGFDYS